MIIKGKQEDLEKLALEIDKATAVSEIPQINIGGGIHGPPVVLTRGQPFIDQDGDTVYAVLIDKEIDGRLLERVLANTRLSSVVTEKAEKSARAEATFASVSAAEMILEEKEP